MEAAVWPIESHSLPFSPFVFTFKCSLPGVVGLIEASCFCSATDVGSPRRSSWLCCCCPVLWRTCCFECVGSSPLPAPTILVSVGVMVGQLSHGFGPGGGWFGQPASIPSLSFPGQAPQHCLGYLTQIILQQEAGQFSCSQVLSLGHLHSQHQGQFYYFAEVRCSTLSPDCWRGGLWGRGRLSSPALTQKQGQL